MRRIALVFMLVMVVGSALSALQLTSRRNVVPYDLPDGQNDEIQNSCSVWGISYSESMLRRLNLDAGQIRRFRMLEQRFEQNRLHLNRMIDEYQREIDSFRFGKNYRRIEELRYLIERTRMEITQNWADFQSEVVRMLNPQQAQIWTNMNSQLCGHEI